VLVEDLRLEALFKKIKQIREEVKAYALGGDDPCVSIDNLHKMVEQMYGLKITLKEVPVSGNHVTSMVRRYSDNTAEIVLRSPQSEAERRFAVAKELLHLALDEPEDWSSQAAVTLDGLIELRRLELNGVSDHTPSPIVICEHLAEIAAIEMLYPYEVRQAVQVQLDTEETKPNLATIALQYKLPVRAIRTAHYRPYRLICEKFRVT
jgi:Zn-dependent peptidase ImmA (M78 family)